MKLWTNIKAWFVGMKDGSGSILQENPPVVNEKTTTKTVIKEEKKSSSI